MIDSDRYMRMHELRICGNGLQGSPMWVQIFQFGSLIRMQMYPPGTTRLCFLIVFFWWRLSTYPPDDSFRWADSFPVPPLYEILILGDPDLRKTWEDWQWITLLCWLWTSSALSPCFWYFGWTKVLSFQILPVTLSKSVSVYRPYLFPWFSLSVFFCRRKFSRLVPSSTFPTALSPASWDTIDEDVPSICDSILHGAHSALLLEILTGHHASRQAVDGRGLEWTFGPTKAVWNLPSSFHGGKICQDMSRCCFRISLVEET